MGKSLQYYYHSEPEAGEDPDFVVESYITKLVGGDNEYIPEGTFCRLKLRELIINLATRSVHHDGFEAIQALAGIGKGHGYADAFWQYVTIRYA